MADIKSTDVFGNLVYYDHTYQRWLDAIGGGVTAKFILNPTYMPVDDTTGDPTGMTMTVVEGGAGNSTAILYQGRLLISSAAADNDGVNLQVNGPAFLMDATTKRIYFGIKFMVNEATESDFLVGLCITDTDLLGGMTDGVYFECLDGSTDINFVLEKDSTETTSAAAVGTLVAGTDVTLEFMFDGTYVDAWVNGVMQTRLATTNLPNDEYLTPSIHWLTGENTANNMRVAWWRAFQIDGTL